MTNKKKNRKNKNQVSSSSSSSATATVSTTANVHQNPPRSVLVVEVPEDKTFPNSEFVDRAEKLLERGQTLTAFEVFKEGSDSGCVPSMITYAVLVSCEHKANLPFSLPWALEGALRGHIGCMSFLKIEIFRNAIPFSAIALAAYWTKTFDSVSLISPKSTEKIKYVRAHLASRCHICEIIDSEEEDVTLRKCDNCKFYHYCSVECQLTHWKEGKHRNECKHIQILTKYHKPYAKEIRDAIIRGDDPKGIKSLQTLRKKLGLTRSEEEYQHLLVSMKDLPRNAINGNSARPDEYLVARKDGTVHIGSTPATI
ncbi:MAG: hypothetical protein ACI90V_013844 [Bacillariaceae sp.]|jgi:uncharacterized protein YnzC (UPF0291/DUF896 family)